LLACTIVNACDLGALFTHGKNILLGEVGMKIVKTLIATVALSCALATTVHARDSFNLGVNVAGHNHARHNIRTHQNTHHYSHYYYRSGPRVVYYLPQMRFRHFRRDSYFGNRDFGEAQRGQHSFRGQRYKRSVPRHKHRHENRGRGNHHGLR